MIETQLAQIAAAILVNESKQPSKNDDAAVDQ
jgi:hypothetical protein